MVTVSSTVQAQRPVLTDEEQVSEAVTKEVDELFQSQDFVKRKTKKFADTKGTMVIDIGVVQNGKVSSFFKVDSEIKNIDFINFMSDYILNHMKLFRNPIDFENVNNEEEIQLTAREVEVLEQLSKGLKYQHIAENLFLSVGTIRKHVENIYTKLQVHNKLEAIQKAKNNKLI
jgi:DNA-binding CsgD family transcriptional regulator